VKLPPGNLLERRFWPASWAVRPKVTSVYPTIRPERSESEQHSPRRPDWIPGAGVGLNHDSGRFSFRINPAQRGVERSSLPYQSRRKRAP
jgi:hypothetical protein